MKRTKIVCTIGPASKSASTLLAMGKTGMDIARLNFSHGTYDEHRAMFKTLGAVGKRLGNPFGILQDLQGPKIRVGELPAKGLKLVAGTQVVFSTAQKIEAGDIPVTLPSLHRDVKPKERMLLDDGLLEVVVKRVEGRRIIAEVVTGGMLTSHKGLNLPGTSLKIPALSEKDRDDAKFGVKLGVDFIAQSFVRSPNDVKDLRKLLNASGGKRIKIIAKIEKREAVERFDEILKRVDGVMVARGDLGIETPAANVPVIQKQIVAACREVAKPVIVATQMLDSMIRNPRPTRAEVSDVANAVADHADAVMLSAESASGAYPVEAVKVMADTIRATEASPFDDLNPFSIHVNRSISETIGASVRTMVDQMDHAPVVVMSEDGEVVREIASFRPETRVFAMTSDPHVARTLRLSWGVEPIVRKSVELKKILKKGQHFISVQDGTVRLVKA